MELERERQAANEEQFLAFSRLKDANAFGQSKGTGFPFSTPKVATDLKKIVDCCSLWSRLTDSKKTCRCHCQAFLEIARCTAPLADGVPVFQESRKTLPEGYD